MTAEAQIKNEIRLAVGSLPGIRIFNNPVGLAYTKSDTGYTPIRMGLCPGSPDLIGWKSVTVTPDMVGRKLAVFAGIEVKNEKGRLRPDQVNFIEVLKDAGALVGVARSAQDARGILEI